MVYNNCALYMLLCKQCRGFYCCSKRVVNVRSVFQEHHLVTWVPLLQEGQALLGDKELEKTRAKTAVVKETEKTPPKPRLPRDSTMAVTAQVGPISVISPLEGATKLKLVPNYSS